MLAHRTADRGRLRHGVLEGADIKLLTGFADVIDDIREGFSVVTSAQRSRSLMFIMTHDDQP